MVDLQDDASGIMRTVCFVSMVVATGLIANTDNPSLPLISGSLFLIFYSPITYASVVRFGSTSVD